MSIWSVIGQAYIAYNNTGIVSNNMEMNTATD